MVFKATGCEGNLRVIVALLLMLLPVGAVAETVDLIGIEMRESGPGSEELVLVFSAQVPELEIRSGASGPSVWLPNTASTASSTDAVRLTRTDEGLELAVNRPGAQLDVVHIRGASVTLRLLQAVRPGDDGQYRLGVGDVVTVSVYREADLSGDFAVLQDGTVLMPLIGPVPAAGGSESELADRIREMLGEFLVGPQVGVGVKTYQSQFVIVTGAVARASRVTLRPGMKLKSVLSEAGIALLDSQDLVLTHVDGSTVRLAADDLDGPSAPLPQGGDVVTVQDPEYIFVSGEVRRPGRMIYEPGLTLQRALVLAEGLSEWASKKEIRIQRQVGGQFVDEVVNLKKVEARRIPDPVLEPGDLIVVRRRLM